MGKIGKTFALILTVIIAISCLTLLTVKPVEAQIGVTNPAIPAFDVTLQTLPNYVQPTYGVDPSTGKAVVTKAGYTEEYVWVNVNIAGQPFQKYNNSAGQTISLYYNVRWEGNHDSSWQSFNYSGGMQYYQDAYGDEAWGTQSTGVLIPVGFKGIDNGAVALQLLDPTATHIDFQVEALIGYYNSNDVFVGQTSGWSNTQTLEVSIPSDAAQSSTTTPSSTPTTSFIPRTSPTITKTPATSSTPAVPEFSILVILPLLLSVFSVAVILRHRKTAKTLFTFASYFIPLLG